MALINVLETDPQAEPENAVEPEKVEVPVETPVEPEKVKEEKVYAGRFKNVEDLEKGYDEMLKMQGRTGQQIGELKSQLEQATAVKPEPTATPATTDFAALQSKLAADYETGAIDFPTYARESNSLTAKAVQEQAQSQINGVLDQATQEFQQTLAQRDEEAAISKFHEKNPTFATLQSEGVFEGIKAADEFVNDDYQAFLVYKAQKAYEDGKQEAIKEVTGSEPAKDVATSPGSAIRNETPVSAKRSLNKAEMFQSGLAALAAARGQ